MGWSRLGVDLCCPVVVFIVRVVHGWSLGSWDVRGGLAWWDIYIYGVVAGWLVHGWIGLDGCDFVQIG